MNNEESIPVNYLGGNVLTNDPSMTAWGWAVIGFNGNIIDFGCIKTESQHKKQRIRKGDDTVRRCSEISRELIGIIRKYNVTYMLSELPHGSQNASAAQMIGMVVGVAQTISDCFNIGIEWYSEADSKKAVLKKISSTKTEMVTAICHLYKDFNKTGVKYKDEAIADALAIHHAAILNSSTLKFLKTISK